MRIGAAARELGLPTHVLRHWEDMGVLVPQRNGGGHREYDGELLTRARLIQIGQAAGLSLVQLRTVLHGHSADRAEMLRGHKHDLSTRIQELRTAQALFGHLLECRHPVVSQCPDCSGFAGAVQQRATRSRAPGLQR
ncbi:MerR family transcriptional regulator [Dermacoccaceae bacterium W4C1]